MARSFNVATSPEYLSELTSGDLRLAPRSCIVPDSGSCRNEDKGPCNLRDKLPSAEAPTIAARGERLRAAAPRLDNTRPQLRPWSPTFLPCPHRFLEAGIGDQNSS